MSGGDLILIEDSLKFVGAFVGLTVAIISYRGFKETDSPTLLRLTMAFSFLGVASLIEGMTGLGMTQLGAQLSTMMPSFLVFAGIFETVGYFFLAFSHVLKVKAMNRIQFVPFVAITPSLITVGLKSLSFYFLFYGIAETLFSFMKHRRKLTLMVALGLSAIAGGELVRMVGQFFSMDYALIVTSMVVRVAGFLMILAPVINFTLRGGKHGNL